MRNLSGQDLFPVLTLLSKVGVKDIIKDFYRNVDEAGGKDKEDAGAEFMGTLIETAMANIERGREDINRLLASLTGITVDEVKALPLDTYGALLVQAATKPELGNFTNSILPFLGK